jgi:glutaredoxin
MKRIDFFTRDGCHLCDEALAVLEQVRQEHGFELTVIDLDREAPPDKREAYDWEVPVVELEGRKIMKYRVDRDRLVRLLAS